MAKQHVSFFERHVEKCALGLGGAVLLGVAALYLVQTPNTVELAGGDKVGPARLYHRIGEQAQAASGEIKNGAFEDQDFQKLPPIGEELNPLQVAKLDPSFAIPIAPPGVDVPDVPGVSHGPTRKIELAEILPPSPPVLTVGRGSIALPPVEVVSSKGSQGGASSLRDGQSAIPRDQFWATVVGVVDRKRQNELFRATRYEPGQDVLVVAGIELERQELLGDGRWSEAVPVQPYAQHVYQDRREVRVIAQKDGTYRVMEDALDLIAWYRNSLSGFEEQAEVLRPEFQPLLEERKHFWRWSVPAKITAFGKELDMCEEQWGVLCFSEEDRPGASASSGGDRPDREDGAAARKAREDLSKAEDLLEEGKYLEAGEILDELQKNDSLSPRQLKDVEDLIRKNERQILEAMNAAVAQKEREEKKLQQQFGPDLDPYWATDISIDPGRTYRYRARVLALNRYAGMPSYLSDPMSAGQVIIPGQWSAWSEPVAVRSAAYLLATQDAGTSDVSVYLYRWQRNEWDKERPGLKVGQEVELASSGETKSILVDFTGSRSFPVSEKNRDGSYHAVMQPTTALTLVNDAGEVEEHLKPLDSIIQDELREVIRKEKKLENQAGGDDRRPDRTPRLGREPTPSRDVRPPDRRRPPDRGRPQRGRDGDRGGGNIAS